MFKDCDEDIDFLILNIDNLVLNSYDYFKLFKWEYSMLDCFLNTEQNIQNDFLKNYYYNKFEKYNIFRDNDINDYKQIREFILLLLTGKFKEKLTKYKEIKSNNNNDNNKKEKNINSVIIEKKNDNKFIELNINNKTEKIDNIINLSKQNDDSFRRIYNNIKTKTEKKDLEKMNKYIIESFNAKSDIMDIINFFDKRNIFILIETAYSEISNFEIKMRKNINDFNERYINLDPNKNLLSKRIHFYKKYIYYITNSEITKIIEQQKDVLIYNLIIILLLNQIQFEKNNDIELISYIKDYIQNSQQ